MNASRKAALDALMEARREVHTPDGGWHAYSVFEYAANDSAATSAIYLADPGSMPESAAPYANAYMILARARSHAAARKAREILSRARRAS